MTSHLQSLEKFPRKYSLNHNFFSIEKESDAQFYWAGFLASSANIVMSDSLYKTYRIEFNLGMKDKSHLENMIKVFEGNIPVREVTVTLRGKPYQQARLLINSSLMAMDLARWGILPKKKFTFKMSDWLIKHDLVRHFIRGWVDGKGNFYSTLIDNKERREFRTSGTILFLEQLNDIFQQKLLLENTTPSLIKEKTGLGKLRILYQLDVEKIANFLYKDSIVGLNRKGKNKYDERI